MLTENRLWSAPVSIAFHPIGFEVGKREEQRSVVRGEDNRAQGRKRKGPDAGNITTEQNTHLDIEGGRAELGFWLCNAASKNGS